MVLLKNSLNWYRYIMMLASHCLVMFNLSIMKGIFPENVASSQVVSKSVDIRFCSIYWPIYSLLTTFENDQANSVWFTSTRGGGLCPHLFSERNGKKNGAMFFWEVAEQCKTWAGQQQGLNLARFSHSGIRRGVQTGHIEWLIDWLLDLRGLIDCKELDMTIFVWKFFFNETFFI